MSKKLIKMTNMKIKEVSRCADVWQIKLFADKIKDKYRLETISSQCLIDFL